jgi:phosphoglycolate phosphatase-like HAD superfamily hydrolase
LAISDATIFIFDVNGVLIDSNRANAVAMGQAFTDDPELRSRIGDLYLQLTGVDRGTKIRVIQEKIVGKPFAGGEFELRWEKFRELAKFSMAQAPLVKGCREVLEDLGRRGFTRVALSNTPESELREILAAQALDSALDIIRGGGNRPKSESLARFLTEFGFDPRQCIFLGDGKGDLAAAKSALVLFFGIDPGTGEFSGQEGVQAVYENLKDWASEFFEISNTTR